MAAIRTTTSMIVRQIFRPSMAFGSVHMLRSSLPAFGGPTRLTFRRLIRYSPIRCAASDSGGGGVGKKAPSQLAQIHQLMLEAKERAASAGNEPIPKVTLDHVTVSFARSSGPGVQNVNKVNTKVDMRFNVKNAYWLNERVRERILAMEKNRINKDGSL